MGNNFNILLISLFNDEAIGLRQLDSILRNRGFKTRLLFLKISSKKEYRERQCDVFMNRIDEVTDEEIAIACDFITSIEPSIIGVSLVSSNFYLYKRLYAKVRKLGDFKLVLGGWQPSLNPEECIDYCDALCIGEGDKAFPEFVEKIFKNQSIADINNLWIKQDGAIVKNKVRPLNRELSSIPIPSFSERDTYFIAHNKMTNSDPQTDNDRYGIIAGRGCPYHCTYCSNSYMLNNIYPRDWSQIRYRSPDHVIDELRAVRAKFFNISRINFYDEVFLPAEKWRKHFFKHYKKEIKLPFYCMFYPGTCNEDTARFLKENLLSGVWLGVQSGSEKVRKEVFKRGYSNEVIINQANIFAKYNISVRYDFIFDNPFESFNESLESIKLMLKLPEPFSLNLFSLKYFPKTDITKMALEAGVVSSEDLNDKLFYDNHNFMISRKENNPDSNFINHLATYVSFLSSKSELQTNKDKIEKMIQNYEVSKNMEYLVQSLHTLLACQ